MKRKDSLIIITKSVHYNIFSQTKLEIIHQKQLKKYNTESNISFKYCVTTPLLINIKYQYPIISCSRYKFHRTYIFFTKRSAMKTHIMTHTGEKHHPKKKIYAEHISNYVVLYCIALHCIALHCIALHCIALHCIALHCIALHCIALHCIALHCIALHCIDCIALHCIALHCIALRCVALRCVALRCVALRCVALRCVALHCIALHCVALHFIALHCIALHCIALHCIALPSGFHGG